MVPGIREAGGDLVVVSPQLPSHSARLVRRHGFTFPLLYDEDLRLSDRLGLSHGFPEELRVVYRGLDVDLPEVNGTDDWRLPMAARYLVDRTGQIRATAINPDYTKRPDPGETLELLAMLS